MISTMLFNCNNFLLGCNTEDNSYGMKEAIDHLKREKSFNDFIHNAKFYEQPAWMHAAEVEGMKNQTRIIDEQWEKILGCINNSKTTSPIVKKEPEKKKKWSPLSSFNRWRKEYVDVDW